MAFYGKTWPIGLAPGMGIKCICCFRSCSWNGLYTATSAWSSISCWSIISINFSDTVKSLVNKLNSKKFKTWYWCWNWFLLAIIGLEIMGVVGDHPVTLVTLGDLKNPLVLLGCLAFVSMIVMEK